MNTIEPPQGGFSATARTDDELKPVTALFADVVGSTVIGEQLPPDEVKLVIGECVSRMAAAVERYGGVVQAYMGDGICAYFGVPLANEDDPERAAHAALGIIESVAQLGRQAPAGSHVADLAVRVGINTGQTAVGYVGASDPKAVALGDTTNTAARIQAAAEPGTILLGQGTADLIRHRFAVEDAGTVTLKGKSQPVQVWRLVATQEVTPASGSAFVDRHNELGEMSRLLADLRTGRGSILVVSGDRGIGKTRLLERFAGEAEGLSRLSGRCLSYGTQTPYQPLIDMLRTWLGLRPDADATGTRTKLRSRLEGLKDAASESNIGHLAGLLGAPFEGSDPTEPRSAEDALVWWVSAVSRQAPTVFVLDDAHWADAPSHDVLARLLELTDRAPLMIVVSLRLDVESPGRALRAAALSDFTHRTMDMQLRPLDEVSAQELADALAPDVALDDEAKATIVRLAEGNPLYLEELLRALIEGGMLVRERTWTLVGSQELLPPALESLLIARVDRLPEDARRVAQIAAVVGREFSVDALADLAGSVDIQRELSLLMRAGIVQEVTRYPRLECAFRHGLVHEAALSTLTPARRRSLYAEVARAHERLFGDSTDDNVELLAFYYYRSDDQERAQHYLERAAAAVEERDGPRAAGILWRRLARVAQTRGDEVAAAAARQHLAAIGEPSEEPTAAAPDDSGPHPETAMEPTERMGEFVLREPIGEGATGVVYLALGPDGKEAAVKVLRPELAADEQFRKRFLHEARATTTVDNDHLVKLLSSGEAEGSFYIAMEYVRGTTLKDRIEAGTLDVLTTARITRQIASALDTLHREGIVHRDLKPANVIIDDENRATLTDLGLAKGRAYTVLTRPGQVLGTLDYMAPEVIKGETATAAADVYSLACIAFECLTGRAPFGDLPVLEVGLAHMAKEPPDASELNGTVGADAAWAVRQGMHKDPEKRPPSAGAFANMLRMAVGR